MTRIAVGSASAGADPTLGGLMEPGHVHPTAIVAPGAELGTDVTIGPYAIVEGRTEIGDGCLVEAHAVIRSHTRMGRRNHVYPHAVVGGDSQDLKFHGEETWLVIGDDNSLREFSTSHRGTEGGNGETRIGNGNLLMAYTHVAHDCILGDGIVMSNNASLAGHVTVGDHAIVGGMSGVHQFVRIGAHGFVGAFSGVAQDVPPWMLAVGPRAVIASPNLVGMRRAGLPRETVSVIKEVFQRLGRTDLLRADILDGIVKDFGAIPEVMDIVTFVRASERGICSMA